MNRRITVRPGKFQSTIGFIAGCIFSLVGIFVVIPNTGIFGIVWTLFAVLITVTMGMNAFSKKKISTQTIEIEDDIQDVDLSHFYTESEVEERLIHLKELFDKNLINEAEYSAKKEEILKRL